VTSDTAIFLTNAASVGADRRRVAKGFPRAKTGPGRVLTIMCAPRHFERGDGRVLALAPEVNDLRELKAGSIDFREYRRRYGHKLMTLPLVAYAPRCLAWTPWTSDERRLVEPGDTLTCACAADAAERGECHRTWASGLLVAAGWPSVILDGRPVFGLHKDGCPMREPARSEGA